MKININNYSFPILLIVMYVLEGVSKYFMYFQFQEIRITRYLKLIIFIYIVIYFIYKKKYKYFIVPFLLTLFFILGHYSMSFKFIDLEIIRVFVKYLFPIFVLEYSYIYFKKNNNKLFFNSFEYVLLINSVLIIFGYIFGVFLFRTYGNNRFGYNGLLLTSATSTYFYIIAIYYIFFIKNITKKSMALGVLIVISSFLVGTKSIYLFIIFLIGFRLFMNIKIAPYVKIFYFLLSILLLLSFFIVVEPKFIKIANNHGLLSSILSYRDVLFMEQTLPFIKENWSLINYFIGGHGSFRSRTQMGIVDLIFFFGFLGGILYLFTFINVLAKSKNKKKYEQEFIIFSIFIIVFLSGNFFYSATITIYLVVLQQLLILNIEK